MPDTKKSCAPYRMTFGSLEIGRFVAALVVSFAHFVLVAGNYAREPGIVLFGGVLAPGGLAVQFFFVLSGFVMMSAHRTDFGQWRAPLRFWARRAGRIYPAYWLALLIVCYYLGGTLTKLHAFQLFSLVPTDVAEFVVPAWTLRFEVAFYLIFGLCLLPVIGRPLLAAWVLVVVWVWFYDIVRGVGGTPLPADGLWADARLFVSFFNFFFFAGLLAGWLFAVMTPRPWLCWLLLIAGLAGVLALLPRMQWGDAYGTPLVMVLSSLSIGTAMLGLVGLERLGIIRCGSFARRLGAMSYPLYILHTPLLLVLQLEGSGIKLSRPGLYAMTAAVMVVFTAISALVAFGIDQPLQRWLRSRSRHQ
jgi:peptidoglycan/LPS O-acetylase OafA/YrhL